MSIARGILDIVEDEMRQHAGSRLKAVNISVGKLAAVSEEQLSWWFSVIVSEAGMTGAVLNVKTVPIGYRCRTCGHEFTVEEIAIKCPECGAGHPEMVSGRELAVESLEVE
jgi:hydrogenase nickel incorporation protein HypA/HybF